MTLLLTTIISYLLSSILMVERYFIERWTAVPPRVVPVYYTYKRDSILVVKSVCLKVHIHVSIGFTDNSSFMNWVQTASPNSMNDQAVVGHMQQNITYHINTKNEGVGIVNFSSFRLIFTVKCCDSQCSHYFRSKMEAVWAQQMLLNPPFRICNILTFNVTGTGHSVFVLQR